MPGWVVKSVGPVRGSGAQQTTSGRRALPKITVMQGRHNYQYYEPTALACCIAVVQGTCKN